MAQTLSTLKLDTKTDSSQLSQSSWILSLATTRAFKYLIICLISFMSFSAYLADEMIAATASDLKNQLHLSTEQLSALYSAGYGLNIPVIILGGLAVDRFGARRVALMCISIILVGVSIFAIFPTFYAKMLGRLIFGVGLEPLEITQDVFLVRWFDREPKKNTCACQNRSMIHQNSPISFSLALSVTFSVNMLGQLAGLLLLPYITKTYGDVSHSYLFVVVASIFSVLACVVLFFVDGVADDNQEKYCDQCLPIECCDASLQSARDILSYLKETRRRICSLPSSFWILMLGSALTFSQQYVFMLFCSDYMHEKWSLSSEEAGRVTAIAYGVALLASPVAGLLLGRIGEPLSCAVFGTSLFSLSLLYLGLVPSQLSPIPPIIAVGISYAIVPSSIWICVVRVSKSTNDVEDGLAFAIATATNSTALLVMPSLLAMLHDRLPRYGYDSVAVMISFLTLLGIVILSRAEDSGSPLHHSSESLLETTCTECANTLPVSDAMGSHASENV